MIHVRRQYAFERMCRVFCLCGGEASEDTIGFKI